MTSAGRFSANWWVDGWPPSAGIADKEHFERRMSLADLEDLQHVLSRAINALATAEEKEKRRQLARIDEEARRDK